MSVEQFIRSKDVAVFKRVAKRFNVYIAVRRTNPASLPYIEKAGYEPKQLNCKFKTADKDAVVEGRHSRVAGLVVDPSQPGMQQAFKSPQKHRKAMEIWRDYGPRFVWQEGDPVTSGKPYLVDRDPTSPHFGALKSGFYHSRRSAKFIHGDYDLYDIVKADDPAKHIVVRETRYDWSGDKGVPHVRVPEFMDIQNNLNNGFGVPMVRHGSQAGFSDYTEDDIDVFFPDGATVKACLGEGQIRALYQREFKGRSHIHKDAPVRPHTGLWITG